jgi:hypothetical protein
MKLVNKVFEAILDMIPSEFIADYAMDKLDMYDFDAMQDRRPDNF